MEIVILTGAGISAESGIKTFRDQGGLWEGHAIEDVASPEGFKRDPSTVYNFYNIRRKQLLGPEVSSNPAHDALSKLQAKMGDNLTLITQNIDDLHERSGHTDVIHMHGELLKMRCQKTNQIFKALKEFNAQTLCPCCKKEKNLRPHVVWFGEMPLFMDKIYQKLEACDLFLSIGTSGVVYPAAMFVQVAKDHGAKCIEFNLNDTPIAPRFDECIKGLASKTVPQYIKEKIYPLLQ